MWFINPLSLPYILIDSPVTDNGYYAYIEASDHSENQSAEMVSISFIPLTGIVFFIK